MADYNYDPEEKEKQNDEGVSPLIRGVAAARLTLYALEFPSIWKTLSKKFPKGMRDNLQRVMPKTGPTESDLSHAIDKTIFEQAIKPENIQRSVVDNMTTLNKILKPDATDAAYSSVWEEEQERLRKKIIISPYTLEKNKIKYLESMIKGSAKDLDLIENGEALQVYRKAAIARYIETIGTQNFLAKYPLLTDFVNGLKTGVMMKTEDVNKIFRDLAATGDANLLASTYITYLQEGDINNTVMMNARSKQVKLLNKPVEYRSQLKIGPSKLSEASIVEFSSHLYKDPEAFADEVMGTVNKHVQWTKEHKVLQTDLKWRNALKEFHNEVHATKTFGGNASFNVRFTSSDPSSGVVDRLEIYSKGATGTNAAWFMDLPKNGYTRGGQRVPQTAIYSGTKFVPMDIIASQVDGFSRNIKSIANAVVNESEGAREVARINKWFDTQFRTSELATGNAFLDAAKRSTISRRDMPWMNATSKGLKNRANALMEYQALNYVKKTGQDIFIYDTEFYAGRTGTQPIVKAPATARMYQISYRRVSSNGVALESGNYYIKDAAFERLKTAYRSGITSPELESLKHSLERTGKGDPKFLDELINTIDREGKDHHEVIEKVFNQAAKGAAIVDFAGEGGSDRAILEYLHPGIFKNRTMMDIFKMQKAASSMGSGFRLTHEFTRIVEDANELQLNKIVDTLSTHSSTKAHNELIHKLSGMKDVHNRKQAIIQAVLADSHDSSVDVGVTHAVLNSMMSPTAQFGSILSATNMLQKIMNTGFLDFKTRVNMLIRANQAIHFVGEGAAGSAYMMATMPNIVSTGGMLKGKTQMFPYHRLDPLNVQDSSLRSIHQVLSGVRLGMLGSHGHMYDPYTTAFRRNLERQSSNIAENIAIHAEPVLVPTLMVAKGYGFVPDDAIMMDNKTLGQAAAPFRHRMRSASFKGLGKEGELFNLLVEATKGSHINVFDPNVVLDPDEINQLLDKHLSQKNNEWGKAWTDSKASVGSLENDFYRMKQDSIIAHDMAGADLRSSHVGNTRFVQVRFTKNKKGETIVQYQLEELITAEKIRTAYGKGIVFSAGEGGVMGILGHHSDHPAVVASRLTERSKITPQMLLSGNLFSRGDVGTTKKLLLNRIYGTFMANKQHHQATDFLQAVFSNAKMSWIDDNKTRVSLEYQTVEEALAIANNIKGDVFFEHMQKAGLTWDTANMKALAETHGVAWVDDMSVMKGRFEDLALRKYDKSVKIPTGVSSTELLNGMMDDEQAKFIRSVYSPWFSFSRNKITASAEDNGRVMDFSETYRDGKRGFIPSLLTFTDIMSSMSYQIQQQKEKSHLLSTTSVIGKQMQALNSMYESSFEKTILDRMVGRKNRKAKRSLLAIFSMVQGNEKLAGVEMHEIEANQFQHIIGRTTSYSEFASYYKKEGIAPDIQSDAAKKFYHESFLRKNVKDLHGEYKDLKAQLDGASFEKRKELIQSMNDIMHRVRGMRTAARSMKEPLAVKDIESRVNTLFEHATRMPGTGELQDRKLGIGDAKVGPYDLIMIKSKGINMTDIFTQVRKNLQILDEDLRINDPAAYKRRKWIDDIINFSEKNMKDKGVRDGIVLPSPGVLMDMMNISDRQFALHDLTALQREGIMNKYQQVISSAVLTTFNEYDNSKGSDFFAKRTTRLYSELLGMMLKSSSGKDGLFSKEVNLRGTYGLLNSPFAFKYQANSMLKDHNKLRDQIRARYRKKLKLEVGVVDTDKAGFLERVTKAEFERSKILNEKIQTGRYNFISSKEFLKMEVNGKTAKQFFQEQIADKKMTRQEYRDIILGRTSLSAGLSRYPLESNQWGLFSGETFIYNEQWAMFKHTRKGAVPSLDTMLLIRADSDGDNIVKRLLQVRDMQEMNKVLKENRTRANEVYEAMSKHQEFLFATGDTTAARQRMHEAYLKEPGGKFRLSELNSVITLSTELIEDYAHRIKYEAGTEHGWKLEQLQQAEIDKIGKLNFIDARKSDIRKFMQGQTIEEFSKEQHMRFKARVVGQSAIGYLSSASSKFKARKDLIMDRLGLIKNNPSVQEDILKLFPGMDPANEGSLKVFNETMNNTWNKMDQEYDNLIRSLTHQGPEQKAISMKRLLEDDSIDHILNLVDNVHDMDKAVGSIKALNVDIDESMLSNWRRFQNLHKAFMKVDPTYRQQYHERTVDLSHSGKSAMDLLNMSIASRFSSGIESLSPKEMSHLLTGYLESSTPTFADRASAAWRDSAKQILDMNPSKTLMGMGIGLGIMTFLSPNALTGGVADFGMDLGHTPGFDTKSGVGIESLEPEPGQDVYAKKWTYLLKNDPVLKDNMSEFSGKSYKDLNMNGKMYTKFNPQKKFKRNYIDMRQSYHARYETNDMRRANIPKF